MSFTDQNTDKKVTAAMLITELQKLPPDTEIYIDVWGCIRTASKVDGYDRIIDINNWNGLEVVH